MSSFYSAEGAARGRGGGVAPWQGHRIGEIVTRLSMRAEPLSLGLNLME